MKKAIGISIVLALALMTLASSVAYAGSAYSNVKAYFRPSNYAPPPGAASQATINYDKELQQWQVHVKVRSLEPNSQYSVELGIQDVVGGGTVIATFTTDGSGNANVSQVSTDLPQSFNVARIIEGEDPISPPWSIAKWRVKMIAQESGYWGLLIFRGSERGE